MFKHDFNKDMMRPDDEFDGSDGQNNPKVFMLSHHKIKASLSHLKVIVVIPVKLGSNQLIELHVLVNSCLIGSIIYIKQGEVSGRQQLE